MTRTRKTFFPGWSMTVEQHGAYWRLVDRAAKASGARTAEARETLRKHLHLQAFGSPKSARDINHLKDFDDFKAACLAVIQPTNLDAQMRQVGMPLTRLVYAIRALAPAAYIVAESKRKFGTEKWEGLSEENMTMFRNHLAARAPHIHWPETATENPF